MRSRFRVSRSAVALLVALLGVGTSGAAAGPAQAASGPPNDFFAFANPVATLPYTDAGVNTALATTETAEPLWDCSGGRDQIHNSVWYKFVAPATTTVSASMVVTNLVGNKVAGIIVAYEGTDLTALGKVGCADDYWHENVPRHLAFPVSAGHTYYIQVGAHGWAASGVFNFTLTAPRSVVTLYASKTSVRHGTSVTLSGTVRPSRPGANVTIQRKVNGVWRTFTTVRLSSASAYRHVWTPRAAGTFVFRATIGARANPYVLGGTSATRKIVVR